MWAAFRWRRSTGTVAKGSIDDVLMFYWFSIVVVEGKLHDQLLKHSGQLAAEMRLARDCEHFRHTMLGKHKHEPEEVFSQVGAWVAYAANQSLLVRCFALTPRVWQVPSILWSP
jgi:hypothetical protein